MDWVDPKRPLHGELDGDADRPFMAGLSHLRKKPRHSKFTDCRRQVGEFPFWRTRVVGNIGNTISVSGFRQQIFRGAICTGLDYK